ncbi:RrF2 family transcriptional regulator [Thermophagus sp. OGC60D27]|uniref:RrF2 family transcriptional regulator n=1 Tax=Thermophagus sp. OGC60D27 TaxID=3458415 RepID=UPI0040381168
MKFSKRIYYGLVFLMQLHYSWPEFKTVKELAISDNLPQKFLEAIAADLRKGGFIEVKRGASGGYRLARVLKKISLLDVVQCLDADWGKDKTDQKEHDHSDKKNVVKLFLENSSNSIDRVLADISLEALPQLHAGGNSLMYYI